VSLLALFALVEYKLFQVFFSKWKGDAFSNNDLNQFLIDNQVNELYLTGIDGLQCVYFTMQGAVNRGYRVYGIREAIDVLYPKNITDVENAYKEFDVNMISIDDF
jgi:nicotinamidase-related amidase